MLFHSRDGFVLELSRSKEDRHRVGGRNPHPKAWCFTCRQPLLLLLTFDVSDPVMRPLRLEVPGGRLPLFYCWGCVPALLTWRVEASGSAIAMNDGVALSYPSDADAPRPLYRGYPPFFPERPARLVPLTAAEQATIRKANAGEVDGDELVPRHQIGGEPYVVQGARAEWDTSCPLCREPMPLLASVANDAGGGEGFAGDDFVQVLVTWCSRCNVFSSWNECD